MHYFIRRHVIRSESVKCPSQTTTTAARHGTAHAAGQKLRRDSDFVQLYKTQ